MVIRRWIFAGFLLLLCADEVLAACKSQVYIIPLFKTATGCGTRGQFSDCGSLLNYFVWDCSGSTTKREQIALLLPPYQAFTLCFLGVRGDCTSISVNSKDVVLEPGKNHTIEDNLAKLLKTDTTQCIDDSMAIFLTDIPCKDYPNYPDMQQLFGDDQLAATIKRFNNEFFLHTVILYLTPNMTDPSTEPCANLQNHHFGHMDYLSFDYLSYDVINNVPYSNICDTTFDLLRNDTQKASNGISQSLTLALIIGCSLVGVLLLGLAAFCIFKVRKRYLESKIDMFAEEHASRARRLLFGDPKPVDEWELTPKELKVEAETVLGSGISATVYKGRVKKKRDNVTVELDVAVKFAHSYADESVRKDMVREIQFMKTLGHHDNLLIMIGCVKDPNNPVIATEFCPHGDLLKVLRKHDLHYLTTEHCTQTDVCLLLADLLRIASQVCAGMVHLSSLKYVHRDLAARNVMLTADLTAKVGDFGLCRLANDALYTQKGGKLPVKHMSLEALRFGEFSEKSDVWAYGILLFEMFSGGQRPFADVDTEQLIQHLDAGGKPEFGEETPEQVLRIANEMCFEKEAATRATFVEIQEEIDRLLEMFDI